MLLSMPGGQGSAEVLEPIPAGQHCWAGRQLQESSRLSGALSFKANIYLPRGILVLHRHSAR